MSYLYSFSSWHFVKSISFHFSLLALSHIRFWQKSRSWQISKLFTRCWDRYGFTVMTKKTKKYIVNLTKNPSTKLSHNLTKESELDIWETCDRFTDFTPTPLSSFPEIQQWISSAGLDGGKSFHFIFIRVSFPQVGGKESTEPTSSLPDPVPLPSCQSCPLSEVGQLALCIHWNSFAIS